MENLVYVKLKNSLVDNDIERQIVQVIEQRIKALPNYMELRLHPELILLACNLIENAAEDRKKKLDKKTVLIKILSSIFNYTEPDKKNVSDTIEFLHSNKKIKKVAMWKKCVAVALDWIKRKFL
jgi:hypothetical protein